LPGSTLFSHGVASGDPTTDRVVIWTRVSSDDDAVPVRWTVGRDPKLTDVVASGEAIAERDHDHTVHVDLEDLEPGASYYYGFSAEGESSEVARTWTLRAEAERLHLATCSCAKFNAGYFNAYSRIADRDDLDFLLHLGDYIYEAGNVPAKGQTPGADIGRPFEPLEECRTLAQYRTRYAQYRRDPDVRAMHRALPIVAMLDDHELADGAWAGGADAHDPAEHGPWAKRRADAFRARAEWLPIRPPDPADPSRVFRSIRVGELAEIFMLDIRSRRDQPTHGPEMSDPARSMLGREQREWLFSALESSSARWKLVATPSILIRTWRDDIDEELRTALLKLKLIDEDGEGPDEDQWDGYPAERGALLERLAGLNDVVVLSADIHVSIASEIHHGGAPVAVELTAPSLTSQNLDEKLAVEPRSESVRAAETALAEAFEHVRWCELSGHGYLVCDVAPERVRGEWWLVEGVLERLAGESMAASYEVSHGAARLKRLAEA
jgi:alkaline phosphatase D